jgi:hypothetical protein
VRLVTTEELDDDTTEFNEASVSTDVRLIAGDNDEPVASIDGYFIELFNIVVDAHGVCPGLGFPLLHYVIPVKDIYKE